MPAGNDDDLDTIIERILPKLGRPSWTPRTTPDDGKHLGTRYGGRPCLGFGYPWPSCALCGARKGLIVQIDLAGLPAELGWPHREGLVQLFACTSLSCKSYDVGGWPVAEARWVPAAIAATFVVGLARDTKREKPMWKPCVVTGWERGRIEFPRYEDPAWDEALTEDERYDRIHDLLERIDARALDTTLADKVGGWPCFTQDPKYPPCPTCRAPMAALLDLTSNGLGGIQWGDLGTAHLFQCREHPDRVAFDWASN